MPGGESGLAAGLDPVEVALASEGTPVDPQTRLPRHVGRRGRVSSQVVPVQ